MDITDQMLKLAVVKSVEAGLLPRRALREEFEDAQNLMRMILQSALNGGSLSQEDDLPQEKTRSAQAFSVSSNRMVPASLHDIY